MSASNTLSEFNFLWSSLTADEGQTPLSLEEPGKPTRLMACGTPEDVASLIDLLQIKGLAQVSEWSPPMPAAQKGEIVRVLTRYYSTSHS